MSAEPRIIKALAVDFEADDRLDHFWIAKCLHRAADWLIEKEVCALSVVILDCDQIVQVLIDPDGMLPPRRRRDHG